MTIQNSRLTAHSVAIAFAALLSACSDTSAPSGETLSVCHVSGATGTLMDLPASQMVEHRSHGDYVARLTVRKTGASNGDGIHFARITDAIASARAVRMLNSETTTAKCRITIAVAPGVFTGSVSDTVKREL